VKTYFDSSALIAAFVEEELHHDAASATLAAINDGFTSTHALAEVFGTLTGGRLALQLTAHEAADVIEANVIGRLDVLELTLRDYREAINQSETSGARGGAIFDMLHLQAARRGKARRIFTINARHFQAFAPDLKDIISLPS
jgi:predicted nucleic acid-binding protein